MDLQQKVAAFSRRHRLLAADDGVLVAVSGGSDSMALLHLLYSLRDQFALSLEVAHLEHGIRGEQAKRDAGFVQDWAERLALPFHCRAVNIPRLLHHAGAGNLEETARLERYRFFAEVAAERRLNKIATAHTQDDQAETVLMWLVRGAGRKGLGGMPPRQVVNAGRVQSSEDVRVIRPLLAVAKAELIRFLTVRNIDFRCDQSNNDTAYLRNWLRHDLLPRLAERIDDRVAMRLAHAAEVFRDEALYLEQLAQHELDRLCANESVSRGEFLRLPTAMRRQVLRLWISRVRDHLRGFSFDHTEALLKMIADGPAQSRGAIPGGWELIREYDSLRVARAARPSVRLCYTYPLTIGKALAVPEAGLTIHSRRVTPAEAELPENHWRRFSIWRR